MERTLRFKAGFLADVIVEGTGLEDVGDYSSVPTRRACSSCGLSVDSKSTATFRRRYAAEAGVLEPAEFA
jgi:hypothetical protein